MMYARQDILTELDLHKLSPISYTFVPTRWSWSEAEYLLDGSTIRATKQSPENNLILRAEDMGQALWMDVPVSLLPDINPNETLNLRLCFTSDARTRLRSKDYFWVILEDRDQERVLLMRPTPQQAQKTWLPNFFEEVIGAWGDEFDAVIQEVDHNEEILT